METASIPESEEDVHNGGDAPVWPLTDRLLIALPVALCIAHGVGLFLFSTYTPRMALFAAAAVPGLISLVNLVLRRERAAQAALISALWILLAATFSGAPTLALKGTVGRELTGVIVIAALGVWALGRQASPWVVDHLRWALLIGVGLNALVGLIQVVFQIETGSLAMQFSRATGLTSNPVYFGALMAAGAGLVAGWSTWSLRYRVVGVVAFGAAANLSGSRVAIAAGIVAVALVLVSREDPGGPWRRLCLPVGYLFGVVASTWPTSAATGVRGASERSTEVGGGGRLDAWRYGLEALADRPIFGWGFGRFRAATQERYSADFVRTSAFDDVRQAWFDAHNVVINTVVAVGVVGLGLLVWFVARAAWRADTQLLLFLAGIVITWIMQPVGLVTLPLAMFTLGVAGSRDEPVVGTDHRVRVGWYQGAALVGILLAGWLVIADLAMKRAVDRSDAQRLERAAVLYPDDSVVADLVAQGMFVEELFDPSVRPKVVEWSQAAIDREPDRPYYWRNHAVRMFSLGEADAARAALDRALELQPWHLQSWQTLYAIAEITEDDELLVAASAKLCELGELLEDC